MALFNGLEDRDLPLLTQVYQLDFEDTNELLEFYRRWHNAYDADGNLTRKVFYQSEKRLLESKELKYFANAVRITREIMDAYERERVVPNKGAHWLADWLSESSTFYVLSPKDADVFIDPKTQIVHGQRLPDGIITYTIPIIVADLWKVVHEDSLKLLRCQECESVCLMLNSRKRFCSKRCTQRAGERRRYKETVMVKIGLKESGIETVGNAAP